jgi:hypothetical protein
MNLISSRRTRWTTALISVSRTLFSRSRSSDQTHAEYVLWRGCNRCKPGPLISTRTRPVCRLLAHRYNVAISLVVCRQPLQVPDLHLEVLFRCSGLEALQPSHSRPVPPSAVVITWLPKSIETAQYDPKSRFTRPGNKLSPALVWPLGGSWLPAGSKQKTIDAYDFR